METLAQAVSGNGMVLPGVKLNAVSPLNMVASGSLLYGDFGTGGLWQWNGTAWSQINAVSPASMVASGSCCMEH